MEINMTHAFSFYPLLQQERFCLWNVTYNIYLKPNIQTFTMLSSPRHSHQIPVTQSILNIHIQQIDSLQQNSQIS